VRGAARILLHLLRTESWLSVRFAVATLGRTVFTAFAILLIREFLGGAIGAGDAIVAQAARAALWSSAALLIVSYIGASALTYDSQVTQQRIVKAVELGTMERVLRRLLSLSVGFYDRHTQGDLIQTVRQDISQLRTASLGVARIVLDGVQAVGLILTAFWLSPSLTLWAFLIIPLAMVPIAYIARRVLVRSWGVRRKGTALFDTLLQLLRGIRVIKVYRGEAAEGERTITQARRYFDELVEMERTRAMARVVLESIGGLTLVGAIIVGGFQVVAGALEWPTLLAFFMAARSAHGPLQNINTSYVDVQRYGASIERIETLLAEQPDVVDRPETIPLAATPRSITFAHVDFDYGHDPVLRDISFEVRAGETLGIVGPSGSGKTTLLSLVARFYDPVAGAVLLDGHDIRDYRMADVFDRIAIVTQDPFLFASSIRENIRCGRPGASDVEIEDAARAADVHDDILAMPDRYDTYVGPGGRILSRGEAQRLNVARAILKNAPVLLLDEATSSLDSFAEARVQRAIDALVRGRTTISIAHRLSTLRNADRILVLEQGRMTAIGSHDELLGGSATYRRHWEAQGSRATQAPGGPTLESA
jgi:subfamily B ATP-binding cassette protein MsbA